jgi:small-conductance mechanosensitive channel
MTPVKLLLAPIRRIVQFPLFQLAVTVAVILWLQAAPDNSVLGQIYNLIDHAVDFTVQRCAALFEVRSFTKSWLTTAFWIAYVYLIGLLILYVLKWIVLSLVEAAARYNIFFLRNSIARERGIEAYKAWLPLERIRPAHISQERWEETYAWPPDNTPPYPPLAYRIIRVVVFYIVLILAAAALLQEFTPVPALSWLGTLARRIVAGT